MACGRLTRCCGLGAHLHNALDRRCLTPHSLLLTPSPWSWMCRQGKEQAEPARCGASHPRAWRCPVVAGPHPTPHCCTPTHAPRVNPQCTPVCATMAPTWSTRYSHSPSARPCLPASQATGCKLRGQRWVAQPRCSWGWARQWRAGVLESCTPCGCTPRCCLAKGASGGPAHAPCAPAHMGSGRRPA